MLCLRPLYIQYLAVGPETPRASLDNCVVKAAAVLFHLTRHSHGRFLRLRRYIKTSVPPRRFHESAAVKHIVELRQFLSAGAHVPVRPRCSLVSARTTALRTRT